MRKLLFSYIENFITLSILACVILAIGWIFLYLVQGAILFGAFLIVSVVAVVVTLLED